MYIYFWVYVIYGCLEGKYLCGYMLLEDVIFFSFIGMVVFYKIEI